MALYVTVMMTALIVSLLGMASIAIVRIERIESESANDMLLARLNAHSAIEFALVAINSNPTWRTMYTSGLEPIIYPMGANELGTYSWILSDSDGDLTDSDTYLTIQGIGRVGDAVQVVQMELEPGRLTCLSSAIHADYNVWIQAAELDADAVVSSNYIMQEFGSSNVSADLEAVASISGDDFTGGTTTGVKPRTVPGTDVFDTYLAIGTVIPYASLDSGGKILNRFLTADHNPYGTPNPLGVYVIDCGGQKIEIENSVIVGTIVLINPKTDSVIGKDHVYWQPEVANFPSLMVSGTINFQVETGAGLLDGVDTGGSTQLDSVFGGVYLDVGGGIVDNLPSGLHGLFYVTGDITITNWEPTFNGVIIGGNNIYLDKNTTVNYSSTFFDNPPPGFLSSEIQVISGSQTRAEAP